MPALEEIAWLGQAHLLIASANIVVSFALVVYILVDNVRNRVAQAFCALLVFVTFVYIGDVFLISEGSLQPASPWRKFQWLGLCLIPAAYLHLSDALLCATNVCSLWRRYAVLLAYGLGGSFLALAIGMDWPTSLQAEPFFGLYTVYFVTLTFWSVFNIYRARARSLTSTTRRRMTYLSIAIIAPGLGVFPYLWLVTGPLVLVLITLVRCIGGALMTVLAGYAIAYQGSLLPDRIIKRRLVEYLVQAPLLATCIIAVILLMPHTDHIAGLPRDVLMTFSIVLGITLYQGAVIAFKPLAYRALYRAENKEVTWVRRLDEHLLTSTDLNQLMENIVVSACDLLGAPSGFITSLNGSHKLLATCGAEKEAQRWLESCDLTALKFKHQTFGGIECKARDQRIFVAEDGFWLFPLPVQGRDLVLGILGVSASRDTLVLTDKECQQMANLVVKASLALNEWNAQEVLFATLRRMVPEIKVLHRWRGVPHYLGALSMEALDCPAFQSPEFVSWVKAALGHYWGGPKLYESPLVQLRLVQQSLKENDYSAVKAVRVVLERAIQALKPSGERSVLDSKWLLYNILEMRFLRGQSARQVANCLAISESDFYRKQRIAVETVAEQVARMEQGLWHEVEVRQDMVRASGELANDLQLTRLAPQVQVQA